MKQTNNAIKFLMAQYRAIFKNANLKMFLAAATAAAALAAGQAQAGANDATLEDKAEWDAAFQAGNTVTITGDASHSGDDGNFQKITISGASGQDAALTLADKQTFKVADLKTAVNLESSGTGNTLSINSEGKNTGSIVVLGDNEKKYQGGGLNLVAKDGGSGSFYVDTVNVQSVLNLSTSGDQSTVLLDANNITIGDGVMTPKTESGKYNVNGRASLWVGHTNSGAMDGSGSATLGNESSIITVEKDGKLGAQGNAGTSTIKAATVNVNGGVLSFSEGLKTDGKISYEATKTNVEAGFVSVKSGAGLTFDMGEAGSLNLNGKSTFEFAGDVTLKNGTINVGSETTMAARDNTGKLIIGSGDTVDATVMVSKQTLKSFLTGKDASGKNPLKYKDEYKQFKNEAEKDQYSEASTGSIQINDNGYLYITEAADLAEKSIFAFGTAAGNIDVQSGGSITGTDLTVSGKLASATELLVDTVNLTLGKADFDSSKSDLGVKSLEAENVKFISKSGEKAFTLKNTLSLHNAGNGTITGAVDVNGGKISIESGKYALEAGKDLTITSGDGNTGLVIDGASLTVSGKLVTTATNGEVRLVDGSLDASKATAYEFGANTFKMSGASALSLDGSKWFTLGDTSGDLVKFKDKVDATAVSGNNISTLTLSGIGSMTMEQFKELKDDTGFTGLFEGFNVTTTDTVSGSVEFGNVEAGTPGSVYHNAQATVSGTITDESKNIGSIKLKEGTSELALSSTDGSNLTLTNAAANGNTKNNFVEDSSGNAASVTFSGGETVLVLQGNGNIGELKASAANAGVFLAGSFDGAKTADVVVKGNIGETNALNVVQAGERSKITVEGTIVNTNEFHSMPGSSFVAKKADVSIAGDTGYVTLMGDITANSLAFTTANSEHMIAGNAHIEVGTLTAPSSGGIQVGDDSVGGLGATVVADVLDLNTGSIFVDPHTGPASLVVAENLSGVHSDGNAGVLNGDVFIGKNAVMAIGYSSADEAIAVVADHLTNGAFAADGEVQNALIINKSVTVESGNAVIVDPSLTAEQVAANPYQNALVLGANANVIFTEDAFGPGMTGTAITFGDTTTAVAQATVEAATGSKISLVGDFDTTNMNGLKFFAAQDTSSAGTVDIKQDITLTAAGDLITATLGKDGKVKDAQLSDTAVAQMRANVSGPIGDLLVASANGGLKGSDGEGYAFLTRLRDDKQFAAVDAIAHAATYAGAQQAAVAAVGTMAEAVGGRVGSMGVEAAAITATGSQANGGVWVAPMYKSVDADGFAAQGVSYGADVDLAGVAFGADTVNGNMRFGAVFNIGSGDADGKVQGNGLKDEFDYYGFGMYTVMGFGNLALVGDASLNVISHDIEGYSGLKDYGNAKGKADTTAVTMGITGQYTISNPMVDVTPHLGARFIRLDTESYDVSTNKGVVASTDFDVQNVFSIPLGVTLSKAFEMGGWSLAPSADLSITFNTGDTEVNSTTQFTGVVKSSALTTEVLDEVTYGINLGLGAQFGAFGTQIGINYTGSENTDAFGVNANARYMF